MRQIKKILPMIMVGLLGFSTFSYADVSPTTNVVANQVHAEHVVWNRVPISFDVPVGQERMLTFPGKIDFEANRVPNLTTDKVRVLNVNGTLYITAKKAFAPIRVPIVLDKSGEIILVDIAGKLNANDIPVNVLLQINASAKRQSTGQSSTPSMPVNYMSLQRYTDHQLFAPERYVTSANNIYRTPMMTSRSVNLVYGDKVMAMPLISWRSGNLYVTAVLLKNIWSRSVAVSLLGLRGKWLSSSFYPPTNVVNRATNPTVHLSKQGTLHDNVTVMVVSNQPFNEALHTMRGYSS